MSPLADGDSSIVCNDFDRETDLVRVAAFDHTIQFAYGINAVCDTLGPVLAPAGKRGRLRLQGG